MSKSIEPTKITMTSYDTTMSWEVPYSDVTIEDMLQGILACMVGLTWSQEQIIIGMKNFVEEHAKICEHSSSI